jgi:hypothetical protein
VLSNVDNMARMWTSLFVVGAICVKIAIYNSYFDVFDILAAIYNSHFDVFNKHVAIYNSHFEALHS